MNGTAKLIIGVVAGAVAAMLCVFLVETLGHSLYPPPPGTDVSDPEQLKAVMADVPAAALAFVAAAWFLGALTGAYVANRVAGRSLAGWIVALLLLAAGGYTLIVIPHPVWLVACGIVLPLLGAWIAQALTRTASD